MNYLQKKDDNISLCYKDTCINAEGDNAKLITIGVFIALLLLGISALAKSN